jgi:sarcosine oxidase subunit alpha
MALVEAELAAVDTRIEIFEDECNGQKLAARVVPMPFYDPHGNRMRM